MWLVATTVLMITEMIMTILMTSSIPSSVIIIMIKICFSSMPQKARSS